jgi:hypothetical protein
MYFTTLKVLALLEASMNGHIIASVFLPTVSDCRDCDIFNNVTPNIIEANLCTTLISLTIAKFVTEFVPLAATKTGPYSIYRHPLKGPKAFRSSMLRELHIVVFSSAMPTDYRLRRKGLSRAGRLSSLLT